MKLKIILLLLGTILIAGAVYAGLTMRETSLGAEKVNALRSVGITNPVVGDAICDKGFCYATIIQYKIKTIQKESCAGDRCTNTTVEVQYPIYQTQVSMVESDYSLEKMNALVDMKLSSIAKDVSSNVVNKGGSVELILR